MPISGGVNPFFSLSPAPPADQPEVVLQVSGAASGQVIGGTHSTEALPSFFRRAVGVLSISGTVSGQDVVVSGTLLSGVRNLQRELALRVADLEADGGAEDSRQARANAILTASGEVIFSDGS